MAMMVKNEEEFLADALESVKDLVDELVVIDTGSSDRTIEIAKEHGAKVYHYLWRDDFSDARNETIRRCTGQWVLILDADERIQMPKKHIENFRQGLHNYLNEGPYIGISVNVINIRLDGSVMNSLPSLRFFPRCEEISYRNRVHNQIHLADDVEMELKVCSFIDVQHLGYDPIVYEKRKKSARSLPLIQKQLIDEPDNMVYKFYEGREYVILKEPSKAVVSLEAAVLGILEGKHGYFAETMKTLLTAYEQVDADPERIIIFTDMAIEKSPDQPDFYLFKGFAQRNIGLKTKAIDTLYEAINRWENFVLTEVSQSNPIIEQRLWLVHHTLANLLWEAERFPEAYTHYIATTEHGLPDNHSCWSSLLNNLIALAIEFEDNPQIDRFLKLLLTRPDTHLDMYFFRLEHLIAHNHRDEALTLLDWGLKTTSRIKKSSGFKDILNKLEQ
jgi:tetratricopeptide (TPR) repeat protein